ncbi:MAG: DUF4214 domain-containing protein [Gammaproteobacteria bacterium]|nr:DUF4214 domain-containing protein [Gammaproteobacteria bacterium]
MTLTIQNGLTTVHTDANAATVSSALSQTLSVARQTAPTGNEDNPFKPTDTDRDGVPDAIEVTQGSNPLVKDNDVFTSDTRFIQQIYRDLLGREADTGGFDFWRSQLTSGVISRTDLIAAYLDSPEFQSQEGAIARLYHAAFDRMPDATGFAYWVQQIQQGASLETISASFLGSLEWAKLAVASDAAFVDHLYHTVLRRDPDAASQAFWEGQLAHGVSRASVLLSFTESLENRAALASKVAVDMLYLGLLDREGDAQVYNDWVSALESGAQTRDQVIDTFLNSQEFHDRVLQPDVTIDTTAPTATVTPATIQNSGYAVVQSSETGTVYLVNDAVTVSNITDITRAADNAWNSVTLSSPNTNISLSAAGLMDGAYHVYAIDAAGNLSAASAHSVTIDTTPPIATVTAATIQNSGYAVVQSSETGTVYLVNDAVTVSSVSDITHAANNAWNSVTVSSANTDTNLSATGLIDGAYRVYSVDVAGNLSSPSTDRVIVSTINSGGGDGGGGGEPPSHAIVGHVIGGPVVAGNDLKAMVYAADGTTLLGEGVINADGSVTVQVGAYTGVVVIHVASTGSQADYFDEATGQPKDLDSAVLSSTGTVTAQGITLTLNINVLTTIAYKKAVEAAGTNPLDAALVSHTNAAVAQAFGLTDLTGDSIQTIVDSSGNAQSANTYGQILAALSGVDQQFSGNTQATINVLTSSIIVAGLTATLDTTTLQVLIDGANTVDPDQTEGLVSAISNATEQSSSSIAIDAVAGDNIINSSEQHTTITGANADGATVTLSIGSNNRTATVNGASWSYTLTDTDISAMGQGSETIVASATLNSTTAQASRGVYIDTMPPTATVAAATIQNTGHAAVQSSETGTAYLVKDTVTVTGVSDITGAADDTWNQVTISNANTDTNLAATGLADGTYHVYAVDAAGNLSVASTNSVTLDSTAPMATVTTATIPNTGHAAVQSSETGTAYLVKDSVTVTGVSDITGAADDAWNSVTISSPNTDTNLAATGLADGTYHVYAVDAAGNLSAASTNSLLIDTTSPTATVAAATIQNTGHAAVQSSETGTAYLVKDTVTVNSVSDITGAADDAWNSVTISSPNTDTHLAATGLADGTYRVYAVDAAGNLSAASAHSVTISSAPSDTTPPTATVTHAIIPDYCHAVVQSSETGTAYLVSDSVSVNNVSDITGAADNTWNSVAITSANTDTDLTAMGLAAGTYHVYTDDAAGNLSAQSDNSVTVTFTNNTITPDQSVVIFDIGSGRSSCHSDRIFDADTNYTIYIIFPNEDGEGGIGTLAEDNKWSGAENLGSDDMVILVGSSTYPLGASGYSYRFIDQLGSATKSMITIRQTTHEKGYISSAMTSAWITLHNNGKLTYNSKYTGTTYIFQSPPDLWNGTMGNMTHPGDHYLLDINTSQGNDTAKMPYGLITSQLGLG